MAADLREQHELPWSKALRLDLWPRRLAS